MLNNTVIEALNDCKDILIHELYNELKKTPGHRVDINVEFLNSFDGDAEIDLITSVYLKDNIVFVDYEDSYDSDLSDPVELFTIDNISDIIDAL